MCVDQSNMKQIHFYMKSEVLQIRKKYSPGILLFTCKMNSKNLAIIIILNDSIRIVKDFFFVNSLETAK